LENKSINNLKTNIITSGGRAKDLDLVGNNHHDNVNHYHGLF
jgi:hypothetical protein